MRVLFKYNAKLERTGNVLLILGLCLCIPLMAFDYKWSAISFACVALIGRGLKYFFGA